MTFSFIDATTKRDLSTLSNARAVVAALCSADSAPDDRPDPFVVADWKRPECLVGAPNDIEGRLTMLTMDQRIDCADMSEVRLSPWARLDSLKFERLDLRGSFAQHIYLTHCIAMRADRADLGNLRAQSADMRRSYFRDANLTNAVMIGANVSNSDFTECLMRNADMRGANLSASNFTRADMRDARLTGANFCGANLLGAQFTVGFNAPPLDVHAMLGADWSIVTRSDITRAMQLFDAECHGDPLAFDRWAESGNGPCPYGGDEGIHRPLRFYESRECWDAGAGDRIANGERIAPNAFQLLMSMMLDKCELFDVDGNRLASLGDVIAAFKRPEITSWKVNVERRVNITQTRIDTAMVYVDAKSAEDAERAVEESGADHWGVDWDYGDAEDDDEDVQEETVESVELD